MQEEHHHYHLQQGFCLCLGNHYNVADRRLNLAVEATCTLYLVGGQQYGSLHPGCRPRFLDHGLHDPTAAAATHRIIRKWHEGLFSGSRVRLVRNLASTFM